MASIAQKSLFVWQDIDILPDLARLKLVLESLPDENLVTTLEQHRGNGRNDYPVRPVWNSLLAGIVFQHPSIASLRRELQRNGQLMQVCGFELALGSATVPPAWVYSRFLKTLMRHQDEVDSMFAALVTQMQTVLPDFGEILAHDGKALPSLGTPAKDLRVRDGRKEQDANWGKKVYKSRRDDGSVWEKVTSWFGFKLHLIVDANYELPVAFEITRASVAEPPQAREMVGLSEESDEKPGFLDRARFFLSDRGNDDTTLVSGLWDQHGIKPVIDIRNMWKDGEETRQVPEAENVVYNFKGDVFCVCLKSGEQKQMAYGGFDAARNSHKYRCPAVHYGVSCAGRVECPVKKQVRVNLSVDRRVFTPLARSSYRFKSLYKKRVAVERVNSRLDEIFGFEKHFIRGLSKMKLRVSLAFCVMLAMAYGRVLSNDVESARCMTRSA
jgi:transposase